MKRYDFTRFRAWQAFKVHTGIEKFLFFAFLLAFLELFDFIITFWYITVPLTIILGCKLLKVAEEQNRQDELNRRKLNVVSEVVWKHKKTHMAKYADLSKDELDEQIKELENIIHTINSDNIYSFYVKEIPELQIRLDLVKSLRG